jgi:IS6 family transposase
VLTCDRDRWFVNETYVKVAGRWRYLYRAVDQYGQVIDVLLSEQRDTAAANATEPSRQPVRRHDPKSPAAVIYPVGGGDVATARSPDALRVDHRVDRVRPVAAEQQPLGRGRLQFSVRCASNPTAG